MGRTWMIEGDIGDPIYNDGIAEFFNFVNVNFNLHSVIPCPCNRCGNIRVLPIPDVKIHLEKNSFSRDYRRWIFHGELDYEDGEFDAEVNNDTAEAAGFDEGDGAYDVYVNNRSPTPDFVLDEKFAEDDGLDDFEVTGDGEIKADDLIEKLTQSEMPLFTGCKKYTKLSAVVKLYNLKGSNGWSDKSFTDLLALLCDMLPDGNVLPRRTYEAKKMIKEIGMEYEKIHACRNDCILYRKLFEKLSYCPRCSEWRYKNKEGIPAKVLWYFPIIPRIIRIYLNEQDAKMLTWHSNGRIEDGKLRHPADGQQWKEFDAKYPDFAKEARNLRLALSTDGMNPHGNMSTQHSTWPVVLAIYNLPPWVCMKRKYLMLSLLISGPRQPRNDIDVYLEPLLDDLKILWESGIPVFDGYKKESFNLRAMLLCTITDFPAYGDLSGHTVHGKEACPLCEGGVESEYLKHSRKHVYRGTRRWLCRDHYYRNLQKPFNGCPEHRGSPHIRNGHEVYEKVKDIEITYGKKGSKLSSRGYKKKPIFFTILPYWRDLPVRHCLDFMHIEKNVCDNIINTLLNVPGRTKDNKAARDDMVEMGIRPELAATVKGNRTFLPPAAHTLSKKEKKEFCECLHGIKVPEGYSSNIRSLVSLQDLKLTGLKSHDCHTLMQQLLAVAIRSILPPKVRQAIIRFCYFFKSINSKVIDPDEAESLQDILVTSLCQFEMYFPPSFFTIMVHLTVHLVREVLYLGPVYLRYQYPFERLMKVYKDYTSNRYRPEGCIAERAIIDEALSYCYAYLSLDELIGAPRNRHSDWMNGKGVSGRVFKDMSPDMRQRAHTYVLFNDDEVQPYRMEHQCYLRVKHPHKSERWYANEHNKKFSDWFKDTIYDDDNPFDQYSPRLRHLAFGPDARASFYSGYAINGNTFYTRSQDEASTMQNSGVCVDSEATYFASSKDKNPILGTMQYYGVIQEILVLDYMDFEIPLFRCKWVDNNNGVRKDDLGFTLVNFDKVGNKNDPFILASQAKQVFYVTDPMDKKWSVVLSCHRRIPDEEEVEFEGLDHSLISEFGNDVENVDIPNIYTRHDHDEGIWVNEGTSKSKKRSRQP
jgi:hypothetical protein